MQAHLWRGLRGLKSLSGRPRAPGPKGKAETVQRTYPKTLALLASVAIWAGPAIAQDADLIARGKLLFEETAGDVGCAMCHGMEATGDADAGAPSIRGVTDAQMKSALAGAVPVMEFIQLTDAERKAVHAYLQSLAQGPVATLGPEAAEGKEIFETTAGGVGCASCHGDGAQGDVGPDIRGKDALAILTQLETNEAMGFIELVPEQIDKVAAYLRFLHDQQAH